MTHGSPTPSSFLVVVGGDPGAAVALPTPAELTGTVVVAADSGVDRALAAGLHVDHVVGDLDSATPSGVAAAEAAGATVHRHEADKDATDLELALDLVRDLAGDREPRPALLVVGSGGGRLDHQLADLLALAAPPLAAFAVTARFGEATATVVRPGRPCTLVGRPGEQVSLLPVHGLATGVNTAGLRWALVDADLVPGTTRAMSNELIGTAGTVTVSTGVLLALQPGTVSPPIAERTTPYDPTPRTADPRSHP